MANTEGHHSFSGAKLEAISWKALTMWTTISILQDGNLTDIFVKASIKTAENLVLNQVERFCQSNNLFFILKPCKCTYSCQSSRESLSSLLQMDGTDTSCWCSNMTPSSSEKMKSPQSRGRSNGLTQKGHFSVLSQLTHHHTFDTCSQKCGFAMIVQSPGWKELQVCFPWWLMSSSPWHEMYKSDINTEPPVGQMQRELLPDPTETFGGLPACSFAPVLFKPALPCALWTWLGKGSWLQSPLNFKSWQNSVPLSYPKHIHSYYHK